MIVARGHVSERPFARTIYAIAARRFTGDLLLTSGGRAFALAWDGGAVVGADSPLPTDSVGRVALTTGLVSTTHVSQSLQRMAQRPGASQLEILAELARLTPEHVVTLRRQVLAHRAMRIFALADATFELDDQRALPPDDAPPLDPRWLIYHGLRAHYDEPRLVRELSSLHGKAVGLAPDAFGAIARFGFGEAERPVLERLRDHMSSLDELVLPGIERRTALAVVYALGACDCLTIGAKVESAVAAPTEQTSKPSPPIATPTQRATVPPPPRPATSSAAPPAARTAAASAAPPPAASPVADEVRALIRDKAAALDGKASHFALLGVGPTASAADVRTGYFALAKKLHPDRLRAVGVTDMATDAQRVFAALNQAFAILGDTSKRAQYEKALAGGGPTSQKEEDARAEELAGRLLGAEDAFRRGEMALRRQQFDQARAHFATAAELNPDDAEHQAMLAWTTFVSAPDKNAVLVDVHRRFDRALELSKACIPARFYRALVMKQTGKEELAIEELKKVLELRPSHADADLELRLLVSRQSKKKDAGLLDKLKRR